MGGHEHTYDVSIRWTGNRGTGTSGYRDYGRTHEITSPGKSTIPGSSDTAFRGEPDRYNPEDLLVASLSACHMLFYLHLCADAGVVVVDYVDNANGVMVETPDGGGHFSEVTLRPVVTITAESDSVPANSLHDRAHQLCFIANSMNFPVKCEPTVRFPEQRRS